jgi:metal-responsive CopG/Arc/MetJ family transcriptional regulator
MKTAISIPDDVFEAAEELARRSGQTRSGLYSRAVREYLARHAPGRVTEALDRALEDVGTPAAASEDAFAVESGRRVLEEAEW